MHFLSLATASVAVFAAMAMAFDVPEETSARMKSIFETQSDTPTVWKCIPVSEKIISTGVTWTQANCSSPGVPFFGPAGPVLVNTIKADLSTPGLKLVPVRSAASANFLQPLNEMAASDGRNLLAGINAGYFWRTDVSKFTDSVCRGKTRADALEPADPLHANYGVGDGSTVSQGAYLSSNCNCPGFSRPTVLTINGLQSRIDVLTRGALPPFNETFDSISSGPNLVSTNAKGPFINIPKDDDNIFNILEHAANTMFGLDSVTGFSYFVTFDGHDGCSFFDPSCGTNAFTMAYYARDHLNVTSAMGMDQGGSTTMFVKGEGKDGIVSQSGGDARKVFNGLFLVSSP